MIHMSQRSTLAVLDLSPGPSGLSRYLEMLWPAITAEFRVVVVGHPTGPMSSWLADEYISATTPFADPVESMTRAAVAPAVVRPGRRLALRPRQLAGHLWRRFAPT